MKKPVAVILAVILILSALMLTAGAAKTEDVKVRDPFVLAYDGTYYLYGTGISWYGYGCRTSTDLENWSDPVKVCDLSDFTDADGQYWAPECHYYNGRFYLFATYHSKKSDKRGTAVFISDSPTGPFTLHSDGHITPKDVDCIDGTLYVDESGNPWLIYVEEWTSKPDKTGTMAVCRLSDDLSQTVGEKKTIFRADDPVWTDKGVTDGPFVYRTKGGTLLMLWSNGSKKGYTVGVAVSTDGRIDGEWQQIDYPLYQKNLLNAGNGGHGMIFTTFDGRLMLTLHSPDNPGEDDFSKPLFLELEDTGHTLIIKSSNYKSDPIKIILNNIRSVLVEIDTLFKIITGRCFAAC